ncbi:MAG: DNRLRE domain-containing protein [Pseudomonadota bacterium]
MTRPVLRTAALVAALLAAPTFAQAQTTVTLEPSRDTALFQEGDLSNGVGPHLYAGQTNLGDNRRSLLAFDFSSIPATATINDATLTLTLSQVCPGCTSRTFTLHRVTGSWGEGTSDAGSPGGMGDAATAGDATWTDRVFGISPWNNQGGDFVAMPSTTATVQSLLGPYDFTGLAADVQAWVSGSTPNEGWILIGEENAQRTALRFDSRENLNLAARPQLSVTFTTLPGTPQPTPATAVPGPGPAAIILLILAVILLSRRWF